MVVVGEEKKHYVLISDFNRFMYDHSLHSLYRGTKHFCWYHLQAFITEEILKHHISSKQTIKMSKKGEYVKFKNLKTHIKSPFMIYLNCESNLGPEDKLKAKSKSVLY